MESNWKIVTIGLLGVILGVIGNSIVRNYENKKIFNLLTKELKQLQEKSNTGPLSADEQKQLDQLKAELYLMRFKCIA